MPPSPSLSRRAFLAAATGGVATLAGATSRRTGPLVFVGTYTEGSGRDGVHVFRMDSETGALRAVGTADVGPEPSFLALSPRGRHLYVANELTQYEGQPSGAVGAFTLAPGTGRLTALGRRASRGGAPVHVTVDAAGRFVLVANYVGGSVAVLPIGRGGGLLAASSVVQHRGTGPDGRRQEGPHAHCVVLDPANRFALVADLGIDRILVYRFDARAGTLAPAATPAVALRPGAGPRHLAFHPSGRFVYVTNELDATLGVFGYAAATGTLTPLQTVPLAPGTPAGEAFPADVHVAASGRHAYASVRGPDTLVAFAIDPSAGTLTPAHVVPTGGRWPRNFGLDPSGRFLYVANQRSNTVDAFRVDAATGALTPTGQRLDVPAPACVRFHAHNAG